MTKKNDFNGGSFLRLYNLGFVTRFKPILGGGDRYRLLLAIIDTVLQSTSHIK